MTKIDVSEINTALRVVDTDQHQINDVTSQSADLLHNACFVSRIRYTVNPTKLEYRRFTLYPNK